MKYTPEYIAELNLLLQFDISSTATGIKVHTDASAEVQAAVASLYAKKLCTQADGGYLTPEGISLAEHANHIIRILSA